MLNSLTINYTYNHIYNNNIIKNNIIKNNIINVYNYNNLFLFFLKKKKNIIIIKNKILYK